MTTIEKFKDMKFKNEYQTRENLEAEMVDVLNTIKTGDIYAQIVSVSSSGMSRKIKFFRVKNYFKFEEINHWADEEGSEVCPYFVIDEIKESKPQIENVTAHIAWLLGRAPIGQYATLSRDGSYNKHFCDTGLTVGGCGMDMIFHTLYSCMVYDEAKHWNQNYRRL